MLLQPFLLQSKPPHQLSQWVPSSLAYVPSSTTSPALLFANLSALQIKSVFQAIGAAIMAVVNGIASILKAIVNGIVSVFNIIIGCLTCNRAGGRRRRMTTTSHV